MSDAALANGPSDGPATKTLAGDWLVDIEAQVLNATWRDPALGQQLLAEYLYRWIDERRLRPRTSDHYHWLARRRIEPALGMLPLHRITPAKVRSWYADMLKSGVSADGASKAYRLLRGVMNTAVADNAIARNPCQIKGAGIHKAPERPTIDLRQALQLERAFPTKLAAMVTLATLGSLRDGEVIGLRRRDIDVPGRTVRIHEQINERSTGEMIVGPPKTAAGVRRIALPAAAIQKLDAHLEAYVDDRPDALLFTNAVGGPIRRSGFNKAVGWKEAVAAIGVPQLHFNDLRHTGNTIAAGTPGTSTRDLMERMGHASMRAALIYQHVNREADRRIADAFDSHLALLEVVPLACPNEGDGAVADGPSSPASVPIQQGRHTYAEAAK